MSSSAPSTDTEIDTVSSEVTYPSCPREGLVTCTRCRRTVAKEALAHHAPCEDEKTDLACEDFDRPRGPGQLMRCLRCLRNFTLDAIAEHRKTHNKSTVGRT
ncbi:hypothetical protein E4U17_001400 [Claviceps sp. LM77 group G4]|nr:hypothetical protein E4U17_001400 [Claviceps sp. LM77 group G4]KAG6078707.1 hypothetical protein E4U16_001509 [Claviceps sp. LM84 group G4]